MSEDGKAMGLKVELSRIDKSISDLRKMLPSIDTNSDSDEDTVMTEYSMTIAQKIDTLNMRRTEVIRLMKAAGIIGPAIDD
jgi:hypothetical protein